MNSPTTNSGINTSTSTRNTSRLSATSSDHLTLAFIKRALTPKAIWTHKVKKFSFINLFSIINIKGRIS
jgi:hypothetical protein